ncbi:MAG: hypothetical protein ACFE68_00785, partial [Candidatus Hodarchaeota archaeon]
MKVFHRLKNTHTIKNRNISSKQLVLAGLFLFFTFSLAIIVPPKITETTSSNKLSQKSSVVETGLKSKGDDWGIEWHQTYGYSPNEKGYWVEQTSDGGYIIMGYRYDPLGDQNGWLIKVDANGEKEWTSGFGSPFGDDVGYCVKETSDGGYIVTGYRTDGDSFTGYIVNAMLSKRSSNGYSLWSKSFGGSEDDMGYSVDQTSDGGYILVGATKSFGSGGYDFLIVKTDENGNEEGAYTYGTTKDEVARCVKKTSDGGYVIAGYYSSIFNYEFLLLKIDSNFNFLWVKDWGGASDDRAYCVDETDDGGYVLVGKTESFGAGSSDVWLIKTDAYGNELWNNTFGGTGYDMGYSVDQTSDGGYIITGYTNSYGAGEYDVWLIKTDVNGTEEWSKTFG